MFNKIFLDAKKASSTNEDRNWGSFIVIKTVTHENDIVYREKLLIVKPDKSLSLHKHQNYIEIWIGKTKFNYLLEDDQGDLIEHHAEPLQRVIIPMNRKHKIINGARELHIFEMQTGIITDHDNIKFE